MKKKLSRDEIRYLKIDLDGVLKDYNNGLHIKEEYRNMNKEAINKLVGLLLMIEEEIKEREVFDEENR